MKDEIAREHFHMLKEIEEKGGFVGFLDAGLFENTEESFVEKYPLSLLGIVSLGKFREVCEEIGVVPEGFWEGKIKRNEFEEKFLEMMITMRYLSEEECPYKYEDIVSLFEKYEKA